MNSLFNPHRHRNSMVLSRVLAGTSNEPHASQYFTISPLGLVVDTHFPISSIDASEPPGKQREILRILLDRSLQQKDLAREIGISGAGLLYHIEKLEAARLITRKTLAEVGNVSLKEVRLYPGAYQRARSIVGIDPGEHVLITAFGIDSPDSKPHTIPSLVKDFLEREGFAISRVVAFVTPKSNIEAARTLVPIDEVINHTYEDYRNDDSPVMLGLGPLLTREMKDRDVIIDVTGLTKLLTIRLLELAGNFALPCVYLGKQAADQDFLLWLRRPQQARE